MPDRKEDIAARKPAPIGSAEEAARRRELVAAGVTDKARWSDPAQLEAAWNERARQTATYIPVGAHVLDLGCGAMALRTMLPQGCRYTPADLVARSEDTILVDFNQEQFPDGKFDVAVLLNVLEFIHEPAKLLAKCRQAAGTLVLSYQVDGGGDKRARRESGYFSDLSESQLQAMLKQAGWRVDMSGRSGATLLLRCVAA